MEEETNNKFSGKNSLSIISFTLFDFITWKFLNSSGSDVPIFSFVFNR